MNFKVLSLAQMITYVDTVPSIFLNQLINVAKPSDEKYFAPGTCQKMESAYPDHKVFLSNYSGVKRFIPEFVKNVINSGAKVIIALGDAQSQNSSTEYAKYFPDVVGDTYEFQRWQSKVTLLDKQVINVNFGEFFINKLKLEQNGKAVEVVQFYFPDWPSDDVPVNRKLAYEFIQMTHSQVFAEPCNPILIHGELHMGSIALFSALERVFAKKATSVDTIRYVITAVRADCKGTLNEIQIESIATLAHNLDVHSPHPTTVEEPSPSRFEVALSVLKQIAQETLKPSILAVVLVHMMQRAEEFGACSA